MATEITQSESSMNKLKEMQWSVVCTLLCDRRMPAKLKGKVNKTVARPSLLYGAETWATTRRHEARLEVNEMRMLRWMCRVTREG